MAVVVNKKILNSPPKSCLFVLFFLSCAVLIFEINLTRLFSVAQFYHFAFMIVSIALLGFGASGTILAFSPEIGQRNLHKTLSLFSITSSISMIIAFLLINWIPFDSFSIAWDRSQVFILALHYLVLTLPFFFAGLVVGMLLIAFPFSAGHIYSVNLSGSAIGCLFALILPGFLGAEGTVMFSSLIAISAAFPFVPRSFSGTKNKSPNWSNVLMVGLLSLMIVLTLSDLGSRLILNKPLPGFHLNISPYKSLSYALQFPGSEIISQKWNSFSRIDKVSSGGIRSLPGLSYEYQHLPPAMDAIFVDGDDLNPVVKTVTDPKVFQSLPTALTFILRPESSALILEPRGGLDILTAQNLGSNQITAVESNSLILEAAAEIYNFPSIQTVIDSDRSFLNRISQNFDVILLSLVSTYHPVRSGAYSLAEDYRYTVESFQEIYKKLDEDGIFVFNRWLQVPPSETLRGMILASTALEKSGYDPKVRIVAFRGYSTGTILVKVSPFTSEELQQIRQFLIERKFDLIYAPDVQADEINRFNILTEPLNYQAFMEYLKANQKTKFFEQYPYEISPPTDDKPFFGHFFKWSQAKLVFAELGKTWQPFGGAGYFVILALLILTVFFSLVLILLPALLFQIRRKNFSVEQDETNSGDPVFSPSRKKFQRYVLFFFAAIGFGFLLVEIPLIQRYILFLGHPAFALTAVLFTILLFSGIGSRISEKVNSPHPLGILVILLFLLPVFLPEIFKHTLGYSFGVRLIITLVTLAPIGFLMGIPFPLGIKTVVKQRSNSTLIPWIWAINGSTSVVAAVLAALIALSFGFSWVFRIGAICYALAWFDIWLMARCLRFQSPRQ